MCPPGNRPSLWTEFSVLTRTAYGILFWPVLALVALILSLLGLFYLFATYWAFGLLAVGALALAIGAFAWWERRR
jgi:hypothetical protein